MESKQIQEYSLRLEKALFDTIAKGPSSSHNKMESMIRKKPTEWIHSFNLSIFYRRSIVDRQIERVC